MAEASAQGGARRSTSGRPILFELARLAAVVALPLLGVIAFLLLDAARRDVAHATDEARGVADETAARIERFLGDFRAALEAVAQRPLVRAMDAANCDPSLPTMRELYPRAGNILVVDREGWILCGAKPPAGGERLRIIDTELHQALMREGGFRLSQPLIGKISKAWAVTAVQAVRGEDGDIVGAVGMAIDLRQLEPFGVLESKDILAGIIARPGIVVARSLDPEQWIGKDVSATPGVAAMLAQNEGTLRAAGLDQRDRLWAFRPVSGTNWIAYASVDAAAANAIAPIALYTDSLLEHENGLTDRARGYLNIIRRSIADVGETVKGMRDFYRPQDSQAALTRIDLNPIVTQVTDLTRVRWRDLPQQRGVAIAVRTELQQPLAAILAQESEIRDALTNLIFNAVDAMPEGGTLTVRTRSSTETVQLEVTDSGVGMDEETRRRCLEPFFTTKGERGTGLGLAMVYGMVRRHSAELEIDSMLHRGTTMRITFPAAQAAAAATPPAVAHERALRPLSILVIDDDPLVLESLRVTLEGDGHKVTAADGGQAGIESFTEAQQRGAPFDVVITDLGMPHVDGRRVSSAVKAVTPSTPVVLLTGWGQRLVDDGDIPAHVDHVLNKPPKLRDLRDALSHVIPKKAEER